MKKPVAFILLFSICIFFAACGANDIKYQLYSIDVSTNHIDYITYDVEAFEKEYPKEANELGKLIIIRNNKELIFNGELTKGINGKAEFLDIGFWVYINVEERAAYDFFQEVQLFHDGLYIWTGVELINNIPTEFIYKYKRAD